MAVGDDSFSAGGDNAWAESWNGSTWTILPMPTPPPNPPGNPPENSLDAVSCATASFCVAVGDRPFVFGLESEADAARWNGTAWTLVPAPFGDGQASVPSLGSVSCPVVGRCQAVATAIYAGSTQSQTLGAEYEQR